MSIPKHASKAARSSPRRSTMRIAQLQRRIQRQVARSDRHHPPKELKGSMQAGARHYPEPPLPAQHRAKPGHESRIDPPRIAGRAPPGNTQFRT